MGDFSGEIWIGVGGFILGCVFMLWAYSKIEDPIPPRDKEKERNNHYQ